MPTTRARSLGVCVLPLPSNGAGKVAPAWVTGLSSVQAHHLPWTCVLHMDRVPCHCSCFPGSVQWASCQHEIGGLAPCAGDATGGDDAAGLLAAAGAGSACVGGGGGSAGGGGGGGSAAADAAGCGAGGVPDEDAHTRSGVTCGAHGRTARHAADTQVPAMSDLGAWAVSIPERQGSWTWSQSELWSDPQLRPQSW
jgi:hypothetical protein